MLIEKLPMLTPVQPEMVKINVNAEWNKASVKEYLLAVTERYKNLIVTDENVDDMAKVLREIVKLRTSLKNFKTKGMRKLKEPATTFGYEVDELINVVTDVENPIREQLDVYEKKRQEELEEKIDKEIELKAKAAGLRLSFKDKFIKDFRWYYKTYKWSQICKDIDAEIARISEEQRMCDERKLLIAERREMVLCHLDIANYKYGLKTPLTIEALTEKEMSELTLKDLKELIHEKAKKQHDIEQAAIEESKRREEQTEPAPEVSPELVKDVAPAVEDEIKRVNVEVVFRDVPQNIIEVLYVRLDNAGFRYDVKGVK